jgi:hypothetical protein
MRLEPEAAPTSAFDQKFTRTRKQYGGVDDCNSFKSESMHIKRLNLWWHCVTLCKEVDKWQKQQL